MPERRSPIAVIVLLSGAAVYASAWRALNGHPIALLFGGFAAFFAVAAIVSPLLRYIALLFALLGAVALWGATLTPAAIQQLIAMTLVAIGALVP